MFLEDDEMEYKLTAPYVDMLLRYFDRNSLMNPCLSSEQLLAAFEKMWTMLAPLAPLKKNDEAKTIWIQVPKGTIEDYGSCNYTFDEAREEEIVETYEDYEKGWRQEYPGDLVWYAVTAVKSFNQDGSLRYYGLQIGYQAVISAVTEERTLGNSEYYPEEAAIKLCDLILPSVQQSVNLLKEGKYNDLVGAELPYQFRTGVIRRADMRAYDPEYKTSDCDGLSEDTLRKFKALVKSGANGKNRIGRIKAFTANDFFRACKLGYEAIGKDCEGFTLPELYMHYSDGRDEGLTGMGHGLNRESGIDFDSSSAWDEWYEGKRGGGHPWEVVPGGNSTHMELYVISEKQELGIDLRFGKITQKEYDERVLSAGYYFRIAGMQRQYESVSFYVALTEAGMPVIIEGAEELLARFEASDYVGIVPHHVPTRYCEDLFPEEYGTIIDFTHVYKDEDLWYEKIIWLPEEPAKLYGN